MTCPKTPREGFVRRLTLGCRERVGEDVRGVEKLWLQVLGMIGKTMLPGGSSGSFSGVVLLLQVAGMASSGLVVI